MPITSHDSHSSKSPSHTSYVKKINDRLSISLTYLRQNNTTDFNNNNTQRPSHRRRSSVKVSSQLSALDLNSDSNQVEVLISFHNTSSADVININPKSDPVQDSNHEENGSSGWFSNLWGGGGGGGDVNNQDQSLITPSAKLNPEVSIMLGYLQLFGYVTLNYKFDLTQLPTGTSDASNAWWNNKSYYDHYQSDLQAEDDDGDDDTREEKLAKTGFLQNNYIKSRMGVGGKLGGVNDLVFNNNANDQNHQNTVDETFVDDTNRYLIQDLLYTFNSLEYSKKIASHGGKIDLNGEVAADDYQDSAADDAIGDGTLSPKSGLPISDITDAIVPFYTTSQHLLFTNLKINPGDTKIFRVKYNSLDPQLPPSYNTNSTGIVCDQGLVSVRYALIVGISEHHAATNRLNSRSIYFPYDVKGSRIGDDERWLQPDYFKTTKVDKSWNVVVEDEEKDSFHQNGQGHELQESKSHSSPSSISREAMLHDLDKLIESDLHSVSKNERRKSSIAGGLNNHNDQIENGAGTVLDPTGATTQIDNSNGGTEVSLIHQLPSHLKTHYQIRVNDHDLCKVMTSRPYFHPGEDFHFSLDINPAGVDTTRVVGLNAHIEAHEIYHSHHKNGKLKDYINIYRVSAPLKINTFATSMINSYLNPLHNNDDTNNSYAHGMIHIPSYLCQQFQSSQFMDLKYFVVFRFDLNEFNRHDQTHNLHDSQLDASTGDLQDHTSPEEGASRDSTAEPITPRISSRSHSRSQSVDTQRSSPPSTNNKATIAPGFTPEYRFDNHHGSEFKFRIPLIVLP